MEEKRLRREELALLSLRGLYESFGYGRFKMNKFEEYDLYVRNKDFLVSDSVITFTDTNGRLMALKPDVTLSIVKNYRDCPGTVQRLYYDENVYRVSGRTGAFKEIAQAGLECLGEVSLTDRCEVIALAARSLGLISPDWVLTVSHLGVVSALLERPELRPIRRELLSCVAERNRQGILCLCAGQGLSQELTAKLESLIDAYGPASQVLLALREKHREPEAAAALDELERAASVLEEAEGLSLCLDFSLVSDMSYYNGFMLQGYVKGIPAAVLRGGQYDNLMRRMGKPAQAMGFAIYLDLLERMEEAKALDVDVLLLCGKEEDAARALRLANALRAGGERVAIHRTVPEKLRWGRIICLEEGGEELV